MAFETGTVELACPACGARHRVRWSRLPVRERFKLRCVACGGTLAERKDVKDYEQPVLLDDTD